MKKLAMFLIIVSLLTVSVSTAVFADEAAEIVKAPFYLVDNGSSNDVTQTLAGGEVKIMTPAGKVGMILQGNIKGLEPNTDYYVWVRDLTGYTGPSLYAYATLGYFKLVKFTTNIKGTGKFHININRSELVARAYKIQVAINKQATTAVNDIGTTIIATQWPGVDATVLAK